MGKVVSIAQPEKRAKARAKREMSRLFEVNAYVNHNAQARVTAGMTHSKTMHDGCDLRGAIAKYDRLTVRDKFHPQRFEWAVAKYNDALKIGVLLCRMPDGVYVLGNDDEVVILSDYPHKIVAMTIDGKLGKWENVDADDTAGHGQVP
jgi:hypothetical protein